MANYDYTVQIDPEEPNLYFNSLKKLFIFLCEKGFVSILRYNDKETGSAYAEVAAEQELSLSEQKQRPFFITACVSDEGAFVPDEVFWIDNYMLGEFYNPERTPYIEQVTSQENNAYL